jgi:polyphosphate kinase
MVPGAEKVIVENGILLIKYFLDVSKQEQERRFRQRIDDPVRSGSSRPWTSRAIAAGGTIRARTTR